MPGSAKATGTALAETGSSESLTPEVGEEK
jgi:hypothetical protein